MGRTNYGGQKQNYDTIVGGFILGLVCVCMLGATFLGVQFMSVALTNDGTLLQDQGQKENPDQNKRKEEIQAANTIDKKRDGEQKNEDPGSNLHATNCAEREEGNGGGKDAATIDAVLTRLLEKLAKGEITLPPCACSCDGGQGSCESAKVKEVTHVTNMTQVTNVTNVTQVKNVTHVTRLHYQCLLSDKIRWGLLENDLKKAVAEEREDKMARMRAETESEMASVSDRVRENKRAGEDQEKRLTHMDDRLRELDSRLALEPQIMELRGFMKIDTFGPVLLVMGALHIILILSVCLLFARPR
ncbi:hypothetical protein ACOMHN_014563 [Nucella lapillus]